MPRSSRFPECDLTIQVFYGVIDDFVDKVGSHVATPLISYDGSSTLNVLIDERVL